MAAASSGESLGARAYREIWQRIVHLEKGRLVDAASVLLVGHGLCLQRDDGTLVALPAIARYRVGEPTTTAQTSLFEEGS